MRGSRIRAAAVFPGYTAVTVGFNYEKSFKENCRSAIEALACRNNVEWIVNEDPVEDKEKNSLIWIVVEKRKS
jgi:hypothetical protein